MITKAIFVVLVLSACTEKVAPNTAFTEKAAPKAIDQCLRREIFKECLGAAPAGPTSAAFNDWSEVVEECGRQAIMISTRDPQFVRPECKVP